MRVSLSNCVVIHILITLYIPTIVTLHFTYYVYIMQEAWIRIPVEVGSVFTVLDFPHCFITKFQENCCRIALKL